MAAFTVVNTYTGTSGSAGSTGISCQAGDMFIAFFLRSGSGTLPTIPSAWFGVETDLTNNFASCIAVIMIKPGTTSQDINQTFTNATQIVILHLRPGTAGKFLCPGRYDYTTTASTNTVTYGFGTITPLDANNWWIVAGFHNQANTNVDTNALTGYTLQAATASIGVHTKDTANGHTAFTDAVGGTAGQATGFAIEIDEYTPVAYGDDFNRSDENLGVSAATGTYGGWNWDTTGTTAGHAGIRSNRLSNLTTSSSGEPYKLAFPHTTAYAEFETRDSTGNSFVLTRMTNINNYTGVRTAFPNINVFTRATSYTSQYNVAHSVVAGDVIGFLQIGSFLNIYRNGTLVAQNVNMAMAIQNGGYVGIHARQATQDPWIDNLLFRTYVHPNEVSSSQNLAVGFLTNTSTLYAPTLAPGSITATPGHLANSNTVYAPTLVAGGLSGMPGFLSEGNTLYAPTLVPGSINAQPGLLTNTSTLYAPSISNLAGEQTALPGLLTNDSTLYAPTLVNMLQTLDVPFLGSGTEVFSPIIYDALFPPSSQRGGFMPSGGRAGHGRFAYIVVEEERKILKAAKSLLKSRKPKRKKRKELAKLIAEEVEERAEAKGHVDIPQRPIYEAALAELEAFTDIVNAEWTMLRPEVIEAIQSAEETATRLVEERLAEEDDDEFYRLMTM